MLAALARRVLHRGSGGTLLVVPTREGSWTRTVEIAHRFATPDAAALHDAVARELGGEDARTFAPDMPEALKWQVIGSIPGHLSAEAAALRRVAPYANVDGAVILTRDLRGARLRRENRLHERHGARARRLGRDADRGRERVAPSVRGALRRSEPRLPRNRRLARRAHLAPPLRRSRARGPIDPQRRVVGLVRSMARIG